MAALRSAMRADAATRARLLGVTGATLAEATAANRAVATAPTLPAMARFTGVLYDAIDPATLSATARRRLDDSVLTFSAIFGVVAPTDPIPDHRLKMSVALGPLGRLSTWWRPRIDEALVDRLGSVGRVWNLLPKEHDAAWTPGRSPVEVIEVRFLDRRPDGSLQAVSHWNKLLKGALVRHLVEHPGTTPESLGRWEHPLGYRLDPDATVDGRAGRSLSLVREP